MLLVDEGLVTNTKESHQGVKGNGLKHDFFTKLALKTQTM